MSVSMTNLVDAAPIEHFVSLTFGVPYGSLQNFECGASEGIFQRHDRYLWSVNEFGERA